MIKIIILTLTLSISVHATDKYMLPSDITILAKQVESNFKKLELQMYNRYILLKKKSKLSESEYEEFSAYEQIFFRPKEVLILPLTKKFPLL